MGFLRRRHRRGRKTSPTMSTVHAALTGIGTLALTDFLLKQMGNPIFKSITAGVLASMGTKDTPEDVVRKAGFPDVEAMANWVQKKRREFGGCEQVDAEEE